MAPTPSTLSLLKFNGQNVFIDCGELDLNSTSFTIEFWAKHFGGKEWNVVVQQGEDGKDRSLHIGFVNDIFAFCFYSDDLVTSKKYIDDAWHHWSCVYDRDRKHQEIFCDGQSVAARSSGNLNSSGNFYIGCYNGTRLFFNGLIAEVRLWKTVRTAADVQRDMNVQLAGQEADLLAYWPLDEGEGKIVKDATGNGHDGTIHNESWQNTAVPFQRHTVQEEIAPATKPNSALKFTNAKSASDYVIVKPFATSPTHALTIEFWIKVGKNGRNNGTPLGISTPNQSNEFIIYGCKNIALYVHAASQSSSIAFKKDQWQHCAVTWESQTGQTQLYIDGESVFSTTLAKGAVLDSQGILVLGQEQDSYGGSFDTSQAFQGQISEVRVWNDVRTPEEIKALMSQRCTGKEEGLVGYWPLDEGEGETVKDKTSNGNDGELHGVTWGTADDLALKPVPTPKRSTPASGALRFPKLSLPVHRPHFIQPALAVDVERGRPEDLVSIRIDLLHGANYNDPAAFSV
ncbi:MAG: cyanobactin biosynthesis system PatB/AcyB/McaB family protein [Spirulina sp. SIO3F2]|nr:cyanobactin biosynthesis system PatB/AcyB/McaB family protein [Spirulina sp. SIO3F2]